MPLPSDEGQLVGMLMLLLLCATLRLFFPGGSHE
jgi:hypothetical protein